METGGKDMDRARERMRKECRRRGNGYGERQVGGQGDGEKGGGRSVHTCDISDPEVLGRVAILPCVNFRSLVLKIHSP